MSFPTVSISWCKPIPCSGLEPSLVPARGAVYEISSGDGPDDERLFMGETDDLRRRLVEHLSNHAGNDALRQRMFERGTCFRYWLCDSRLTRSQVAAALWDRYAYECGGSWDDHGGACVRLLEDE